MITTVTRHSVISCKACEGQSFTFRESYGTGADVELEKRRVATKGSIAATLEAIKRTAEAGNWES